MKYVLVSFIALVSVALGEAGLLFWIGVASFDVTGNLFLIGVLPLQLIVIGLATLSLTKIYQSNFRILVATFVVVHLTVYTVLLRQTLNPWGDIAGYWGCFLVAYAIWFAVVRPRQSG